MSPRRKARTARSLALVAIIACPTSATTTIRAAQEKDEPICLVPVLRNGEFAEPSNPELGGIPWWSPIPVGGAGGEVVAGPDGPELMLSGEGASVAQNAPAFPPFVGDVVLRGRVRGAGEMVLYGGTTASEQFLTAAERPRDFEVVLREATKMQGGPRPRLRLQLAGLSEAGIAQPSWWSRIEMLAPLPCPSEDALRADLVARLERYFDPILGGSPGLEAALDDVGPRATPFVAFQLDVDSGERLAPEKRVGHVSFHARLLRAWRAAPRPEWEAALAEFTGAYLDLCIHPETGLERRWDPVADEPLDALAVEIHLGLKFLLDVAEHGPEPLRARCLAAAERMARAALEHGALPDGEVAASYSPATGEPNFDVDRLRRLDVPAQLARVAALSADAALAALCLDAAEQACLTLGYDHYWPGDWANIDPGFDDNYGHYGARAAVMWEAHPENEVFRALVMSGWRRYAPLWRDALRYGGNVAADQVRCWKIAATIAELEPDRRDEVAALLDAAAFAHFQGEQIAGGAWIDTTFKRFNPVDLPVGDTGGVPQNLLAGLGIVYGERELGLATDEVRAMFTAVLRTTDAEFGRAHGFAPMRGADPDPDGGTSAWPGSTGVAAGVIEMLEALSE